VKDSLINDDLLQRKRHYWKLDSNALTLYKDESTSRYYKVCPSTSAYFFVFV